MHQFRQTQQGEQGIRLCYSSLWSQKPVPPFVPPFLSVRPELIESLESVVI